MICLDMYKGFPGTDTDIETPNDIIFTEKPLNNKAIKKDRVDINKLKAKLQQKESKELKKNIAILSTLVLGLAIVGVYLSL
jgi:hypothetical protein